VTTWWDQSIVNIIVEVLNSDTVTGVLGHAGAKQDTQEKGVPNAHMLIMQKVNSAFLVSIVPMIVLQMVIAITPQVSACVETTALAMIARYLTANNLMKSASSVRVIDVLGVTMAITISTTSAILVKLMICDVFFVMRKHV
jgi:hypothetical protein